MVILDDYSIEEYDRKIVITIPLAKEKLSNTELNVILTVVKGMYEKTYSLTKGE